ncbi:MAG TPA: methyltransferase domain-containing protein [Streptosporangiaceae bacterium]|jgi:SAM-dependent methyltransferase
MSSDIRAAYDQIGIGYATVRRPDPRLAAIIATGLGEAASVVNVGAGAGSYEPSGRDVVAVEPSAVMLAQHPGRRRVRAAAQALPFTAGAFDAAMAVMTVHHWADLAAGLAEMRRVAARQLVFTWDPGWDRVLWVVEEYVPEIGDLERSRFAPLEQVVEVMAAHTVVPFPVPWDFADGYQPAFWRRPEAYLDPRIRAASSTFASLPDAVVTPAMDRLRRDLDSGTWHQRHRDLLQAEAVDYGYRLLIAG